MKEKLKIKKSDLRTISSAATRAFDDAESFSGMDSSEMSAYLLLKGFETFLKSKEIDIPFEINISTKRYR